MDNKTQRLFIEADRGVSTERDGQCRCMGCMELYSSEYELCPYCGYQADQKVENALHMYPGTVLNEKYVIGRVLGYGGFGVTYIAWDTVLQIKVAIKEYLPSEYSTRSAGQSYVTVFSGEKNKQFNEGKSKFIDEAKRLAMFRNESGIVKIFDSFEENGTAYIVMEYLEGETLAARLEREKTMSADEAIKMLEPVIDSLRKVHASGIIHRDIAPDNIFLTDKGGVKLIDFGASRYATADNEQSLTIIIKQGYSAEEQYRSRGDQGAHTDVYSVGAVLYKMITGHIPPDAMKRRASFEKSNKDPLVPIRKFSKDISKEQENAIYNAMNIRVDDRTPDMTTLSEELFGSGTVKRRKSGLKKIDPLTWPMWAKIGVPAAFVVIVALSVLFALGIIGPRSSLKTGYEVPEGQTLIPNVVASELDDAKRRLEKSELQWRIADTMLSETIESGMVVVQNPDAMNIKPIGTYVDITISEGFGLAFVEDYTGCDYEEVKALLEGMGFTVEAQEKDSSVYGKGVIFDQSIRETSAEIGTKITLYISKGEGYDTSAEVAIPNVVGKTYTEAKTVLDSVHLAIVKNVNFVYDPTKKDGEIVSQTPEAGTTGHCGDRVRVTVNCSNETVRVPKVTEHAQAQAVSKLEKAGLVAKIEYGKNPHYSVGTVYAQSIAADEAVSIGTEVVLTVCEGYTAEVPDVRNMTLAQAQKALMESGFASAVQEYMVSPDVKKGCIVAQSEAAGSRVSTDTVIYLTVSSDVNDSKVNTVPSVASGNILGQGVCGVNLKWVLYKNGELVITGSGDMFDEPEWTLLAVNIKEVIFNGNITSIGKQAFKACTNLAKIAIPATVKIIGNNAFDSCTALKNVVIPNGVTSIGGSAFASCSSLTSVSIPESVVEVGDYAFNNCTALIEASVPENGANISSDTFNNCQKLTEVKVSNEKKSLDKYISENSSQTSKVTLPDIPKEQPTTAKKPTVSVNNNLTVPQVTTEELYKHILETGTGMNGEAVSEETLKKVTAYAVQNSEALKNLNISEDMMQEIAEFALENSSALKNVEISDEMMQEIAKFALENGDALKNITISEDMMKEIVSFALENGDALKNIKISESMMKEIINFMSENGSVLSDLQISESMMKEIIKYISSSGSGGMKISDSLMKEIAKYVSQNGSILKEIKISDSFMKEILKFISSNGSAMGDIEISKDALDAFSGFIQQNGSELSDITIPKEVIDFGLNAFSNMQGY